MIITTSLANLASMCRYVSKGAIKSYLDQELSSTTQQKTKKQSKHSRHDFHIFGHSKSSRLTAVYPQRLRANNAPGIYEHL